MTDMESVIIEEYNPIDGPFYLITINRELIAKAYDLKTARIIKAAFESEITAKKAAEQED